MKNLTLKEIDMKGGGSPSSNHLETPESHVNTSESHLDKLKVM